MYDIDFLFRQMVYLMPKWALGRMIKRPISEMVVYQRMHQRTSKFKYYVLDGNQTRNHPNKTTIYHKIKQKNAYLKIIIYFP